MPPFFYVLPFDVVSFTALLIRDTNASLVRASERYDIAGFAYVFEVGQPEPCFYFAIDTGSNAPDPSTGEWTHPANGFTGSEISEEWYSHYALHDAYMSDDDDCESHLHEVHAFFCSVMKQVREHWIQRLPRCIFTVNECNDSDEALQITYNGINDLV